MSPTQASCQLSASFEKSLSFSPRYLPGLLSGATFASLTIIQHRARKGPFSEMLGCNRAPLCLEVLFSLDLREHPQPHSRVCTERRCRRPESLVSYSWAYHAVLFKNREPLQGLLRQVCLPCHLCVFKAFVPAVRDCQQPHMVGKQP